MENTKTCAYCATDISSRATKCPHCRSRQPDAPPMHRDMPGKMFLGVCTAVASELGLDVTLVRAIFVVGMAVTGWIFAWGYFLIWFVTPPTVHGRSPMNRLIDGFNDLTSSRGSVDPRPPQS
jgi:phage shock protein PspC (stress-responsive transcriptional regulator)